MRTSNSLHFGAAFINVSRHQEPKEGPAVKHPYVSIYIIPDESLPLNNEKPVQGDEVRFSVSRDDADRIGYDVFRFRHPNIGAVINLIKARALCLPEKQMEVCRLLLEAFKAQQSPLIADNSEILEQALCPESLESGRAGNLQGTAFRTYTDSLVIEPFGMQLPK